MTADAFLPPAASGIGGHDGGSNPAVDLALRFATEHHVHVPQGTGESDALARIWSALSSAGMPYPGLSFARWAAPTLLGGVFPTILANSPDVGALLERLHHFHPLFGRDRTVLTHEGRSTSLGLEASDGTPAHPDTVDACFTIVCTLTRRLTADATGATRVALRRTTPPDPQIYRELIGDVRFNAEHDRCTFDANSLVISIARADPSILAALEPYAERRVAEQGRAWSAVVADLVAAQIEAPPTLASLCGSLALSPRALQLRLATEGTTFSAIVDQMQRERALTLLATSDLPITTIATTVGFSSPAVLTRAVRRWTGLTPTDYRAAQ